MSRAQPDPSLPLSGTPDSVQIVGASDTSAISRQFDKRWLVPVACVLLSRLIFALAVWKIGGSAGFATADTDWYLRLAQSMLHGNFALADGSPHVLRTPGYPLLLMPAVASGYPLLFAVLENSLLAACGAWMVFRIARRMFPGSQVPVWAVALYGMDPIGFFCSVTVMSDMLFCVLLLVCAEILLADFLEPGFRRLAMAALVLSLATYVRPASLYLPLWLAPFLLIVPRSMPWPRRMARSVFFPLVFGLALAPWVIRNRIEAGYSGFSSAGDFNLYFLGAASVQAHVEHRPLLDVQLELEHAHAQQPPQFWRSQALRIIASHPGYYLMIYGRAAAVVLFDGGGSSIGGLLKIYPSLGTHMLLRFADQGILRGALWFWRQYPWTVLLTVFLGFWILFYYFLALNGLRKMPAWTAALFIYLGVYFVLVSSWPVGAIGRYRAPVMPFVCIAAGAALAGWRERRYARLSAVTRIDDRHINDGQAVLRTSLSATKFPESLADNRNLARFLGVLDCVIQEHTA